MKTRFLILFLPFLLAVSLCAAQDNERALVEQTVSYYLDGGTNNDFETLRKAFHKNASMKFISGEGYKEVNAIDFFEKAIKPGPKQNRTTQIVAVNIAGNAATAQLRIDYPTFYFMDFMNLLKIDGEWKIVSKIFHRQPK